MPCSTGSAAPRSWSTPLRGADGGVAGGPGPATAPARQHADGPPRGRRRPGAGALGPAGAPAVGGPAGAADHLAVPAPGHRGPAGARGHPAELLLALDDLAGRLRSGGTQPEVSGETRHLVGFTTREQADAFAAGAARRAGDEVEGPVPADADRWVGDVQWQVTVRVVEPPMSPAFDARIAGLHALADAHAGHLGGWEA
ncbi:ribonuclease E inhibitor RraB [Klenkia terrae]|uniref:ribonuclease E inhibitor RraB n=1 Tax=Klenkia terrae TaxID=1052259 RepID=UPI003614893B